MRADMGGAATTLASALAIARLKLPLNLIVATPMTENMPGGGATKPGDVYVISHTLLFRPLRARLMRVPPNPPAVLVGCRSFRFRFPQSTVSCRT